MKYKMLVLDMDGTLLSDEKKISDINREALSRAAEAGVMVVISTGRIFTSAMMFAGMLGLGTPIIASNGAYVRAISGDPIYSEPMRGRDVRKIVDLGHKFGVYPQVFTWDTIYTEKVIYFSANYSKWNKQLPEDRRVRIEVIKPEQWDSIIDDNGGKLLKTVAADDDGDNVAHMRSEVQKLDVEVASSGLNNFEVMAGGVSKGRAVEMLSKHYGIERSAVICIGDSENDMSMIKYAGLGVAMGNGMDAVRKAADFVTLSNNDDGVAYVVDKFILNGEEQAYI